MAPPEPEAPPPGVEPSLMDSSDFPSTPEFTPSDPVAGFSHDASDHTHHFRTQHLAELSVKGAVQMARARNYQTDKY